MYSIKETTKQLIRKIALRIFPELHYITSNIGKDVTLENNIKITSPSHIHNTSIGRYTYIATNSSISVTEIGSFCSIGPNFVCGKGIHPLDGISTNPMFYSLMKQNGVTLCKKQKFEESKKVIIGNDVFIGANVTVLDGCRIGDGAVIGAGAVVSKDIPPFAVAVGCPIRIIRYRFPKEICEKIQSIKWWEFNEHQLLQVEKFQFDVQEFIRKNDN